MTTTGMRLLFGAVAMAAIAALVAGGLGGSVVATITLTSAAIGLGVVAVVVTWHRDFNVDARTAGETEPHLATASWWPALAAAALITMTLGVVVGRFMWWFGGFVLVASAAGWSFRGLIDSGRPDPGELESRSAAFPAPLASFRHARGVLRAIDVGALVVGAALTARGLATGSMSVLVGFGVLTIVVAGHASVEWVLSSPSEDAAVARLDEGVTHRSPA